MAGKGNNRLPYGLCKGLGIEVPEGTEPYEAWQLLEKETGYTQNQIYEILRGGYTKAKTIVPIKLSSYEYEVLRKEVFNKNILQKGKVKPTNFAYTANFFYIYSTTGDDYFTPVIQLDIEEDREFINAIKELLK